REKPLLEGDRNRHLVLILVHIACEGGRVELRWALRNGAKVEQRVVRGARSIQPVDDPAHIAHRDRRKLCKSLAVEYPAQEIGRGPSGEIEPLAGGGGFDRVLPERLRGLECRRGSLFSIARSRGCGEQHQSHDRKANPVHGNRSVIKAIGRALWRRQYESLCLVAAGCSEVQCLTARETASRPARHAMRASGPIWAGSRHALRQAACSDLRSTVGAMPRSLRRRSAG